MVSALAGVGLTLAGTALADKRKAKHERQRVGEDRIFQVGADLSRALTELARTLRTTAEQLDELASSAVDQFVTRINDLVGQTRSHSALMRIIAAPQVVAKVCEIESALAPLQTLAASATRSGDDTALVESATVLIGLRDNLIGEVRSAAGIS